MQECGLAGLPWAHERLGDLMVDSLERLLAQLDSADGGEAEEAQASLIALGPAAGPALVVALPTLSRLGKLCAIEVVQAWGYRAGAPALVPLLRDESDTVRQWAAQALGELGHVAAVPELLALANRLEAEQVSPNWTEPVAVRAALTALGARRPVLPALLLDTVERRETGDVWPARHLEDLLLALAQAEQVILGFQVWRRDARWGLLWQDNVSLGWTVDRRASWSANVVEGLAAARMEADELPREREELVVTLEWIDSQDLAVGSS